MQAAVLQAADDSIREVMERRMRRQGLKGVYGRGAGGGGVHGGRSHSRVRLEQQPLSTAAPDVKGSGYLRQNPVWVNSRRDF